VLFILYDRVDADENSVGWKNIVVQSGPLREFRGPKAIEKDD